MKYEEKISIIKKVYEKVRKKYNLPLLKDLQIEFLFYVEDLSGEEEMILTSLRSSILNFISSVRRDIEALLSGAESYCCYFERRAFNKN